MGNLITMSIENIWQEQCWGGKHNFFFFKLVSKLVSQTNITKQNPNESIHMIISNGHIYLSKVCI